MARVRSSMAVMRFSMSPMFILAIFGSPLACFLAVAGFEGGAVWRVRCSAFAFSRSVAARSAAARSDSPESSRRARSASPRIDPIDCSLSADTCTLRAYRSYFWTWSRTARRNRPTLDWYSGGGGGRYPYRSRSRALGASQ